MKLALPILILAIVGIHSSFAQSCCNNFEAAFNYFPTQTENRIEFQNLSTGNWTDIIWNFGDGTTSTGTSPDHVYSEPGIYQVCLVIENNDCRSELCYEVAVETADPCNDFLADYLWNVNPSNSLGVQFENTSVHSSDHYIWNFGDNSSSDDMEPYHEFPEAGMYQVCLVLESNNGCRSEYCREVCVVAPSPEPPTAANCCDGFEADFAYFPTQTDNRIEFQNLSQGEWNSIVWHFGDGTSSELNSPDHIYDHSGIYQVCVVIENNDGCRSELCYEVAVETTPDPCNDFLADFNWDENIDSLGIQFHSAGTLNSEFRVWHFGDGSTSDQLEPYHEYEHPGVYQVCLVIESNDGCRSEYCRSVCVEDFNPCEDFGVSFHWTSGGVNGHLIEFDGLYSSVVSTITWNFGDGASSMDENPHHEYAQSGTYEVCLLVENEHGCSAHYCHSIVVDLQNDSCENFSADFAYVVDFENGGVHFENLSTGEATNVTWHFGDDTFSTDAEPTHHYAHTGVFNACLRIENEHCVSEICQPVFLPSYYFHVAPPLGLIEAALSENGLMVYPNPVQDILHFAEPLRGYLQLMDVRGSSVTSGQVSGIHSMDLSDMTAGIYIMRITDRDTIRTIRIVKK